jgi:hypothetical protein
MLVVICVLCVLLGVVVNIGFNITGFNGFLTQNITAQNELQMTLYTFVTELRSMGPSAVGAYPIESASATSLVFFSDIDQDGVFERLRYYLNGNIMMKGVIKPSGAPLTYDPANEKTTEAVHNVISSSNPIFSYFAYKSILTDPIMTAPVTVSLIRAVKFQLTTGTTGINQSASVSYGVFGTIRNLRTIQ